MPPRSASTRGPRSRASSAEAGTLGAAGLPPVVQAWLDAYNARDGEAMATLYADDGVYEDVPNAFVVRGMEIAPFPRSAEQGLTDARVELRGALHGERWAVVEYEFHATNGGTIPSAKPGASFVSRAVTVFELDGGKILRTSDYYDMAGIMAQLGLLPRLAPSSPIDLL